MRIIGFINTWSEQKELQILILRVPWIQFHFFYSDLTYLSSIINEKPKRIWVKQSKTNFEDRGNLFADVSIQHETQSQYFSTFSAQTKQALGIPIINQSALMYYLRVIKGSIMWLKRIPSRRGGRLQASYTWEINKV